MPRQLIYLSSLSGAKPKRVCENSPDAAQGDCQGFGGLFRRQVSPAPAAATRLGNHVCRPGGELPQFPMLGHPGVSGSPGADLVCAAFEQPVSVLGFSEL